MPYETRRLSPSQALAQASAVPIGLFEISARTPLSVSVGASIAVCLIDDKTGMIGLRQVILPADLRHRRHHAMLRADAALEDLCYKLCAAIGQTASAHDPRRLHAKIAGGADCGASGLSSASGPNSATFVTSWLNTRKIRVTSQNIGGQMARQLVFLPGCGTVYCRQSKLKSGFLRDELERLTAPPESHHHIEGY